MSWKFLLMRLLRPGKGELWSQHRGNLQRGSGCRGRWKRCCVGVALGREAEQQVGVGVLTAP